MLLIDEITYICENNVALIEKANPKGVFRKKHF